MANDDVRASLILGLIRHIPPARPLINTEPRFVTSQRSQPLTNSPSPLKAQHWRAALERYPTNLGDVLADIVTYGALVGYDGPNSHILSNNLTSAADAPHIIDKQLTEDLRLGRVTVANDIAHDTTLPFISSPLGLVPKSDGGHRRIHHLSFPNNDSVNDNIPKLSATLKYTAITDVLDAVKRAGREAVIVKRDFKDAFRMVPVAASHRWLLGFGWRNQYYSENCLPFGLRTAPFLFNLFAEAFHWIILAASPPEWKLQVIHYLDDFIMVLPPDTDPLPLISLYDDLCWLLGLEDNTKKGSEGTCIECLGVEIDTSSMTARLPLSKISKGYQLVSDALEAGNLTKEKTEHLTGFLSFCATVIPPGRTFLASLWHFQHTYREPKAYRPLTSDAITDLEWWKATLPLATGTRLLDDATRYTYHLWTDASNLGLGGFYYKGSPADTDWQQVLIPQEQAYALLSTENAHINTAEINAIVVELKLWAGTFTRSFVIIHADNTTAEHAFGTGTTRGTESMRLMRDVVVLIAALDIKVHACRVSSANNGLADALSRFDWRRVANFCPQWSTPLTTRIRPDGIAHLYPSGSETMNASRACSGTASSRQLAVATTPALFPTLPGASTTAGIPGQPVSQTSSTGVLDASTGTLFSRDKLKSRPRH